MIDARELFKSGRRYRGFVRYRGEYIPSTFTVFPLNARELRLKYFFPTNVMDTLKKGDIIYCLLEEGNNLVAELRVVREEEKSVKVSVDFVSKDRRSLPRVKVEGFLDIKAYLVCSDQRVEGNIVDISMSSLSIRTERRINSSGCTVEIIYDPYRIVLNCKVIRQDEGKIVVVPEENNRDMVTILGKIYSDLFLKAQRLLT